MRWPPWRRDEAGSGALPARAAAARTAAAPPAEAGWAYLPPLQRTLAAAPRITAPHDLVAWRSPAFTGRMSHAVSTAAPAGVVDGDGRGLLAGAPLTREPALDMPLLAAPGAVRDAPQALTRSVPSALPSALVVAPAPQRPSLTVSRAVEVPLPVARPVDPGAEVAAGPAPAAGENSGDVLPADEPVADSAERPALFTDPAAAAVFAQGMVLHDNGGATEVALPRPLPAAATPLGPGVRPAGRPAPTAGPRPSPVQRAAATPPDGPAAQASGEVRPPRRLGLGAPLPSMPVARRAASEAAPTVLPSRALPPGPVTGTSAATGPEPPRAPEAVAMPVQRDAEVAASPAQPAAPPAPGDEAPASASPVEGPVEDDAPLLAERAPTSEPEVRVQRDEVAPDAPSTPPLPLAVRPDLPETGSAPASGAAPAAPAVQRSVDLLFARPLPLRVAADAPARAIPSRTTAPAQRVTLLPPAAPVAAPAPVSRAATPAPRAVAAPRSGMTPPSPQPALPSASPPTASRVQRLADAPGAPRAAFPATPPSPATAADPFVQRRPAVASPAATPLRRPVSPSPYSAGLAALPADQLRLAVAYRPQLAVDQRWGARSDDGHAPGTGGGVSTGVAVQRESEPVPAAAPAPEAAPTAADTGVDAATTSAAQAATAVAPAAPSPTSPEELDKLAARLVEPLTRRIKAEMIIDRERRGLRSDPR